MILTSSGIMGITHETQGRHADRCCVTHHVKINLPLAAKNPPLERMHQFVANATGQ